MKRLSFILILCLATTGCNQAEKVLSARKKKKDTMQADTMPKVNNSDLAKIILTREKVKLDISRDPFTPIRQSSGSSDAQETSWGTEDVRNFKFKGVSKIGDQYIAFLQNGSKKGAFRLQDTIGEYVIKKIDADSVVLSNGVQEVTLKRGDRSE